jgi:hypothetical protein
MSEGRAIGSLPFEADPLAVGPVAYPDPTFELILTVTIPPKRVRTPNRKTKTSKATSESKGPFDVPVTLGWTGFLGTVAEKLAVQVSDLVITSFEWHWLKPTSGPWLPVQDESGFISMLKKVRVKPEAYIIVRMHPPLQKASGNAWDVENEPESDFEDSSVAKKVRICIVSAY